mgnify:CR=1 FL=1
MPELPEVETIRRGLEKYLVGHKIVDLKVKSPKIFDGKKGDIVGSKVEKIRRFAKVLSIDLSGGNSIVIHVKLTGQLIYRGPKLTDAPQLSKKVVGGIPGPHTHLIFKLDKGGFLYYNDVRKFGWVKIVKTAQVETSGFVAKLGPEPQVTKSSPGQAVLTLKLFKEILSKTTRPIKVVLMDQEKIGGIGNIYANDALFLAKINPKKESRKLGKEEIENLYKAIHKVLKNGLRYAGASELSYVTARGEEGEYQNHFLAYGRDGELCKRCHQAKLVKFRLGGRGTYFCPACQR